MTKIVLNNVGNLVDTTTAQTTINDNFQAIQNAWDDNLSRDGTSPNQMEDILDMNSFQIVNLPDPATANSPLRLQDLSDFTGGGTVSNIPAGGTTNQVLGKNSNADYDLSWKSTGSGTVTSVGLAMPADLTVTNSPVTSAGTLTANWTTTPTGTGAVVRSNTPTLVTPILGTPTSVNLSNATNVPLAAVTGLGAGIGTFLATPSSANLSTSVTDETGTGSLVFGISPSLTTPTIGSAGMTLVGSTSGTTVLKANATAAGTLTLPAVTDTIAVTAGTQTLTNKTISGSGNTLSNIALSSHATQAANTIVANATTGSAVPTAVDISTLTAKASPASTDLVMISDQAASGALKKATVSSIASAGSVASIAGNTGAFTLSNGITNSTNDIRLNIGQLPGVATNSNATAGNIGELISSTVSAGGAVPLTTTTTANVTSISLTAGDWDVTGTVQFSQNSTASAATTGLAAGISTTTANIPGVAPGVTVFPCPTSGGFAFVENASLPIAPVRISIASTTTVFLTTRCTFSAGTTACYGYIGARRMR